MAISELSQSPPLARVPAGAVVAQHPALSRADLVGLPYVGLALKLPTASAATLKRLVADLVEAHGFPLPNPRRWNGRLVLSGAGSVTVRSLWNRQEVDHWIASMSPDGTTPGAAAGNVTALARARQVDDHVGQRLRLIAGGRS